MEDRNQSDRIFSYIDEQKNMGKTVAEEDIEEKNHKAQELWKEKVWRGYAELKKAGFKGGDSLFLIAAYFAGKPDKTITPLLRRLQMVMKEREDLKAGDVLIGMASTGVHSNGFSLVRKVFDMTKESLDTYYDELGTTLGEALLAPTRIYVKALKSIKNAGVRVHACSHITGGGFYENIPRMLKDGTRAVVEKNSYPVLPIFKLLAEKGNIEEQMMYNTYNMGLGMVLAVDAADVDKTMEAIKAAGDTPYVVGRIEAGEKGVTLC